VATEGVLRHLHTGVNYANTYSVHHLLDFVQINCTQQLLTKNHASAELPEKKNYRFDPTWTSLPAEGTACQGLP